MLTIYGRANSFNVQKAMWLVGELGIAHNRLDVGGKFGGRDEPKFRAMNPHGWIPVIDDDGTIVWESNAIVRYLAARYGASTDWWPSDPGKRAKGDQWMDWASSTLNVGFMGVFLGFYRTPEAKRDWTKIKADLARAATHYGLLDRHLASRAYVAGDAPSIGDIPIGATLYRYFTLEIERPRLPNLEAYYKRLTARPAYARHVMVGYEDLKGNL